MDDIHRDKEKEKRTLLWAWTNNGVRVTMRRTIVVPSSCRAFYIERWHKRQKGFEVVVSKDKCCGPCK